MKKFTPGVRFSWLISSWEAASFKHKQIQPEHVLIGLLSLVKALDLDFYRRLSPDERRMVQSEIQLITDVVESAGQSTANFRRALRQNLTRGRFRNKQQILHRSELLKKHFEIAEEFASKADQLNVLHLLAALIKEPNEIIAKALNSLQIDTAILWKQIMSLDPDVPHDHKDDGIGPFGIMLESLSLLLDTETGGQVHR